MKTSQEIYIAALDLDENKIRTYPWLGYWNEKGMPPIARLAFENQDKAVALLLRYGASESEAVYGYALAGNEGKVAEYLKRGDYNSSVAHGYAMAGDHEKVEKYRRLGANVSGIAQEYALAGNHKKVGEYRELGANLANIAMGYAMAGNDKKVAEYLERGDYSSSVAYAYALVGNDEKVEKYRALGAHVTHIAQGYAMAGNDEKVEQYIKLGADLLHIASGYAMVGNYSAAKNMLLRACLIKAQELKSTQHVSLSVTTNILAQEIKKLQKLIGILLDPPEQYRRVGDALLALELSNTLTIAPDLHNDPAVLRPPVVSISQENSSNNPGNASVDNADVSKTGHVEHSLFDSRALGVQRRKGNSDPLDDHQPSSLPVETHPKKS